MDHQYTLVAVARTPQLAAGPTLFEVGPIKTGGLYFRQELNRPSRIQFGTDPDNLNESIRNRLLDLRRNPTEVWLYRDDVLVEAGILTVGTMQSGTLSVYAHGLLYYLKYMYVNADNRFTATDQFTIGKWLVDQWQALDYGNFGIDTSTIGTSGVLRDRTFLTAENMNVLEELTDLSEIVNGFDFWIDPTTRRLRFEYPKKGVDLSLNIKIDRRNIRDETTTFSVQHDDLASEMFATGRAREGDTVITSRVSNTDVRQTYGRVGYAAVYDDVSVQATLDNYASMALNERLEQKLEPGSDLIPVEGVDVLDFNVGDSVEYSYDAGIGLQSGVFRVLAKEVSIDESGNESMKAVFS